MLQHAQTTSGGRLGSNASHPEACPSVPRACRRWLFRVESQLMAKGAYPRKSAEERFWAKVEKRGTEDCWLWTGGKTVKGYGVFWNNERFVHAQRFAYELLVGPIPDGMFVCHHCDNPPCCNPKHLFLGTHKDNMRDAVAKGRMASGERHGTHTHPERTARGENSGTAKLNAAQVRVIRLSCAAGTASKAALARFYGVTETNIRLIVTRKTWKHVDCKESNRAGAVVATAERGK